LFFSARPSCQLVPSLYRRHPAASPSLSFSPSTRPPASAHFSRQGNARQSPAPAAPVPLPAPLLHPPHAVREPHHPNTEASDHDRTISSHSKHRRCTVPSLDVDFASHLRARVPDRLPALVSWSEPPCPPRRREIASVLASASPMPRRATMPCLVRACRAILSY
jgi:hypothetical protein